MRLAKDESVGVTLRLRQKEEEEEKKSAPHWTRRLELQLGSKPLSPPTAKKKQRRRRYRNVPCEGPLARVRFGLGLVDGGVGRGDKVVAIYRACTLSEWPTRRRVGGIKDQGGTQTDQAGQLWRSRALDQARLLICTRRTSAVTSPGMTSLLPARHFTQTRGT